MNSDARRILSHFDSRGSFDPYQHYAGGQLRDRLHNPSVLVTVILLAATIIYQAAYQQGRVPWLPHLLWDSLVAVIPARLLFAVHRFLKPSLFPPHMSPTPAPTHAAKSEALRSIMGVDNAAGLLGSVSQVGRRGFTTVANIAFVNIPAMSNWSSMSPISIVSPFKGGSSGSGKNQPPGLGNYSNSCFQNSILQGLTSLKSLPAYLAAVSQERSPDSPPINTADALRDLIAQLSSPANNGKTLWTPDPLKHMSTWHQQDAQEYYSKLLDQVDTEIAKATRARHSSGIESDEESAPSQHSDDSGYCGAEVSPKPEPDPRRLRHPLEGLMAQRVACVNCGYCEGLTMIPFNCLTLNLGNLREHDLYERLDHYTKIEAIPGIECSKCTVLAYRDQVKTLAESTGLPHVLDRLRLVEEVLAEEKFEDATLKKCNITPKMRTNTTKTKQVALSRMPRSIVFHVNRSGFDESTGYMFKNSAAVRFPMVLDMGPWCLGSADGPLTVEEGGKITIPSPDEERWTLEPKSTMVAADQQPSKFAGPIYELRAVVAHYGHHENGHYICYRKHAVRPGPSSTAAAQEDAAEDPFDTLTDEGISIDDMTSGSETEQAITPDTSTPIPSELQSRWWRFSDEDVDEVDEKTVLAQGGVFMLFYDCVDPSLVLVSGTGEKDQATQIPEDSQAIDLSNVQYTPCSTPPTPFSVQESIQESIESPATNPVSDSVNTSVKKSKTNRPTSRSESPEREVPLVYADISSCQMPIAVLKNVHGGGVTVVKTGVKPQDWHPPLSEIAEGLLNGIVDTAPAAGDGV
ncbi:ubiquitin-specific protease ubp1 [Collariella sp. IMI 366227]|nr:ubiquitin-specific protease ubp1 [Collariella sp. IMI 366227]